MLLIHFFQFKADPLQDVELFHFLEPFKGLTGEHKQVKIQFEIITIWGHRCDL